MPTSPSDQFYERLIQAPKKMNRTDKAGLAVVEGPILGKRLFAENKDE